MREVISPAPSDETRAARQRHRRERVAEWPPPSPELLAQVATLLFDGSITAASSVEAAT